MAWGVLRMLTSWANLYGSKHRDQSESRAQARQQTQIRLQEAIEQEQSRSHQLMMADRTSEAQNAAEMAQIENEDRQPEPSADQSGDIENKDAERLAEVRVREEAAREAFRQAAERVREAAARESSSPVPLRTEPVQPERFSASVLPDPAPAALEFSAPQAQDAPSQFANATQRSIASMFQAALQTHQPAADRGTPAVPGPEEYFGTNGRGANAVPPPEEYLGANGRGANPVPTPEEYLGTNGRGANPAAPTEEYLGTNARGANPVPAPEEYFGMNGRASNPVARPEEYLGTSGRGVNPVPTPEEYLGTNGRGVNPVARPEERPTISDQSENTVRVERRSAERIEASSLRKSEPVKQEPVHGREERPAAKWFALRTVFDFNNPAPIEPEATEKPAQAPVIAVFSLAGGIGKTSLVATLGRALSARGERVLLVDTAAYGLMPFYFGAHDHRPGVLRTFSPPGTVGDSPIQMLALDPDSLGAENPAVDPLVSEIGKYSRGVSRVIIDLATASGATSRRVMRMNPMVIVPIVPDMNSVVSVSSLDRFFEHNQNGNGHGKPSLPFYVLNRFDPSVPLHLDIREMLREELGERLLPFVLHRSPAVSEAMAEGMTVMDYAPESTVAEDFGSLAGWVKAQSAPAVRAYRGVRWSER